MTKRSPLARGRSAARQTCAFTPAFKRALSRVGLMLGTALGGAIAIGTLAAPTTALAADVSCSPDSSGATTSGPEFCQFTGDGITYTAVGDLTVVLDDVHAQTTGLTINAPGASDITVYDLFVAGDLINGAGDGVKLTSAGGDLSLDTTTGGATRTSGTFVYGVTDGAYLGTTGTGTVKVNAGSNINGRNVGLETSAHDGNTTIVSGGDSSYNRGIVALSHAGGISIEVAGAVSGDFDGDGAGEGIYAEVATTGNLSVTVDAGQSVVGGAGSAGNLGINLRGGFGTTDVTLDSGSHVQSGIYAGGVGAITIDMSAGGGSVSNTGGAAISARGGTGLITVNGAGETISGSTYGVEAVGAQGGVYVYGDQVHATTGDAIYAGVGTIGSGSVYVRLATGADITSTSGAGIRTVTGTGAIDIYGGSGGNISGASGIVALAGNSAYITAIFIDVGGNVTGTTGDGVHAYAKGGGIYVDVGGNVTGHHDGVYAKAKAGDVTVYVDGDVTGATAEGVSAKINSPASTGDITVRVGGQVYGATTGVDASNNGSGSVTISTNGVTGKASLGIFASTEGAGALSVTDTGTVYGYEVGINVEALGAGDMTVIANTVIGKTEVGVEALAYGGNVSVTVGNVTAATEGVFASARGAGTVGVYVGNVTVSAGNGVFARSQAGAITVTSTGTMYGRYYGIEAKSSGVGDVTVISGDVTGEVDIGIDAESKGGDVSITAGNVTGGADGVKAITTGTGDVSVDVGNVHAGVSGYGVFATAVDGNVSVTAYNVSAHQGGVHAYTADGAITIITTGAVQAGVHDGIYAYSKGGGDVNVTAYRSVYTNSGPVGLSATGAQAVNVTVEGVGSDVTGHQFGVVAQSTGGGGVTVNVSGNVTGGNYGLYVYTSYGAGNISATVGGNVTGGKDGVYAQIKGVAATGNLSVAVAGQVYGGYTGVYARQGGTGALTVSTNGVTGKTGVGISAYSKGGAVGVTDTGAVYGYLEGVFAETNSANDVTVKTGAVTSETSHGVFAVSEGGNVSITTYGDVAGGVDNAAGTGIQTSTNGAGTITVKSYGAVSGANGGINAIGYDGKVSVSAYGLITGDSDHAGGEAGIQVGTHAGDISIYTSKTGSISGYSGTGIYAHTQTGAVHIDAEGGIGSQINRVTGDGARVIVGDAAATSDVYVKTGGTLYAQGYGVKVENAGSGNTTVITSNVYAHDDAGVLVKATGGGNISEHSYGVVTSVTGVGAGLYATGGSGSITATFDERVYGETKAIVATAAGLGDVSVTASAGAYAKTGDEAILAVSQGGNVTVTVGAYSDVTAKKSSSVGIEATTTGTGAVTVYVGDGSTIHAGKYGVYAMSGTGNVSVTTGAITAANGVYASTGGAGNVRVETLGNITSTSSGIFTQTDSGSNKVYVYGGIDAGGSIGIDAHSGAGAIFVRTGSGADISNATYGVYAYSKDSANTYVGVFAQGNITASKDGVFAARGGSGAGEVYVGGIGDITGDHDGINARNTSTGDTIVAVGGNITGLGGDGVSAVARGNVSVSAEGSAYGGNTGIYGHSTGSGDVTIVTAAVTGHTASAVIASSYGGNVSVSTYGDLSGAGDGVMAKTTGTGALNFYTVGESTITATGDGLFGRTDAGNITVVSHADIIADPGINMATGGTGVINVKSYGDITAMAGGIVTSTVDGYNKVYVHGTVIGDSDLNNSGDGVEAISTGVGGVLVHTYKGGDISGDSDRGIYAHGSGNAAYVTVVHDGDIGSASNAVASEGIDAWITVGVAGSGNVSVTGAGNVYATSNGIYAFNNGTGTITVSTTGNTTSLGGNGIQVVGYGGQETVYNGGVIHAGAGGVYARHNAPIGGVEVTNNGSIGTSGQAVGGIGVYARNFGGGTGAVTVYGTGDVYASSGGIRTYNNGTGGSIIDVSGNVTTNGAGVNVVDTGGGAVSVDVGGNVTAGGNGVYASASGGNGALDVTTGGLISGSGIGIVALQHNTGGMIVTEDGGVSGTAAGTGIRAIDYAAAGDAVVHVSGDVGSSGDHVGAYGVYAAISGGVGALTIDGAGNIYADTAGVRAFSNASGDIVVNLSGNITAGTYGVTVGNTGGGSAIATVGAVTAGSDGVRDYAFGGGTGGASVTTNGLVDAHGAYAISARTNGTGGVTVNEYGGVTANVTNGVIAGDYASAGDINVVIKGGIGSSSASVGGYGVRAYITGGGSGAIAISGGGDIYATGTGVRASTNASGGIDIDFAGNVTSANNVGFLAEAYTASDVRVSVDGAVKAHHQGVFAYSKGGAVKVYTGGGVVSTTSDAIDATTIDDGDVTVGSRYNEHELAGAIVALNGTGILARTNTGDITVAGYASATIESKFDGVDAKTAGNINIQLDGDVTSHNDVGISAISTGAGNVTVYSAGVYGGAGQGILATSQGGAISVSTYGDVTSKGYSAIVAKTTGAGNIHVYTASGYTLTADGDGIYGHSDTGDITVVSKSTIVADPGINLSTGGAGVLNTQSFGAITALAGGIITATADGYNRVYVHGTVEGDSDNDGVGGGVVATSSGAGAVLVHTYAGGDIGGHTVNGILAASYGGGAYVNVIADGDIGTSGLAVAGAGVLAILKGGGAGSISITGGGDIYSHGVGAYAYDAGTGGVVIDLGGNITSTAGHGVSAQDHGGGGVSITTGGTIHAGEDGLYALEFAGSGNAAVTAEGGIGSSGNPVGGFGVRAEILATGAGEISVNATNIYSIDTGVFAYNDAVGGILVDLSGNITAGSTISATGSGVDASGRGNVSVTVDGAITAGADGVVANGGLGDGNVSVSVTGAVNAGLTGVQARTQGHGDVVVDTAAVTGGLSGQSASGIVAYTPLGTVNVHATGFVYGNAYGISAYGGGNVTVHADAGASGHDFAGIDAHSGGGDAHVYAGGPVSGGTYGVLAVTLSGTTGGVIIDTQGTVTSAGYGVFGVAGGSTGSGDVSITTVGLVTGDKRGVYGRNAGSGDVVIETGSVTSANGAGVEGVATGAGDTLITTDGLITGGTSGIDALDLGSGYVEISEKGGVAGGGTGSGIFAYTSDGTRGVHIAAGGAIGSSLSAVGGDGIYAGVKGGSGDLVVFAHTIYADQAGLGAFNNGTGDVLVKAYDNVTAQTGGVMAVGNGGNVSVTAYGDITTHSGVALMGVTAGTGEVTITSTAGKTLTSTLGDGIYAKSYGGDITINSNAAIIADPGIHAVAYDNAKITINSNATIQALNNGIESLSLNGANDIYVHADIEGDHDNNGHGAGVLAQTVAGDILVRTYAGADIVGHNEVGLYALATGAGAITFIADGNIGSAVTPTTEDGLVAIVRGAGGGDISITGAGVIHAGYAGVYASSKSSGVIDIDLAGNIYAGSQFGIGAFLTGTGGTIDITSPGKITTTGLTDGIYAGSQAGAAVITVNASGLIDPQGGGDGIFVNNLGSGATTVTADAISGDAKNGIVAMGAGGGTVTVNVNAAIGSSSNAVGGMGVFASGAGGAGLVKVDGAGTIYATGSGIVAKAAGAGQSVLITGTGAIFAGGAGLYASASGAGGGTVTIVNGSNIVAGDGGIVATDTNAAGTGLVSISNGGVVDSASVAIMASNTGSGGVVVSDSISATINGDASFGIVAQALGGGSAIVHHDGSIGSGGNYIHGDGVYAEVGAGSGNVTVDGLGAIWAARYGVNAFNTAATANASISVISVDDVRAGNDAIHVRGAGTGASTLYVNSSAAAYSGAGDGIDVAQTNAANTGAVTVISTGNEDGGLAGVRLANAGTGGASFTNTGGFVYGGKYGVYANTASSVTVNNTGASLIYGQHGFAIDVTGGGAVINNGAQAQIRGYAHFAGGTTVNNAGLWEAYGSTTFGAGADTVNNSGSIVVAQFTSTPVQTSWTGLEVFNNQGGLIDMRNGHAGDVLSLGSAAFTGSTVAGVSSRLDIDASLTTTLASDSLVIGAASGTTLITVHDVSPGAMAGINVAGVTVVNATSGTGSEFALAGGPIQKGFVLYKLQFEAATDDWNLVGLPAQTGYELLKAPEAAQGFWRRSGDAWSSREQEIRDSLWGSSTPTRGEGWEMWAQGNMGNEKLGSIESFAVGGGVTQQNLGSNSEWGGFQMGVDNRTSGNWLWGLTAGYVDQDTRFRADNNALDIAGWNVGAYGGVTAGGFYLNGLVKGDFYRVLANMHTFPAMDHLDGTTWGAKVETGFRFGGPRLYVEPAADLAWTTTHLDHANFPILQTNFIWDQATSLRGSLGARVGGQIGAILPYVGVYAVDEFEGANRMTMMTGAGCPAACTDIRDVKSGSYGRASFGFTTTSWNGLEGFLKGDVEFANHTEGFDGSLGVRWTW
jgi:uncharacterized protein YhjY with autotransporter beta-barrel domain